MHSVPDGDKAIQAYSTHGQSLKCTGSSRIELILSEQDFCAIDRSPRRIPILGALLVLLIDANIDEANTAPPSSYLWQSVLIPGALGCVIKRMKTWDPSLIGVRHFRYSPGSLSTVKALSDLRSSRLLGSRLIPNIGKTINMCVELVQKPRNLESTAAVSEILLRAIKHAKVPELSKRANCYSTFYCRSLIFVDKMIKLSRKRNNQDRINCLLSVSILGFKINDETLKPLLFRLIDWATIDLPTNGNQPGVSRSIALYKVFGALLSHLQTLAVSYFTHLINHTVTILNGFVEGNQSDFELWVSVTSTLEQTIIHDTEGFWSATALTKITMPIISQIKLGSKFTIHQEYSSRVKSLIGKLAHKKSNLEMMTKKKKDYNIKLISLEVLEEIWKEIGPTLVPFVPETMWLSYRALEESNGGIDQAAKKVVKRIELEIGESIEEIRENSMSPVAVDHTLHWRHPVDVTVKIMEGFCIPLVACKLYWFEGMKVIIWFVAELSDGFNFQHIQFDVTICLTL
ncbi:hypothetical protein H4Q26_006034 [Puccinia striiformis f. sp. tritici PST-130]|nr:hypothetical protein H4Q26_006034 [Puccinia striiformis f. sp. tritici PST-130]